jgi:hypothetical protein
MHTLHQAALLCQLIPSGTEYDRISLPSSARKRVQTIHVTTTGHSECSLTMAQDSRIIFTQMGSFWLCTVLDVGFLHIERYFTT